MKICENCSASHSGEYGSGRFCSTKCSRGFSTKNNRIEINKKVSLTLKSANRKISEEQKNKLSKSVKSYWANKVRKHTLESRIKLSESLKQVKRIKGEKVFKLCKSCKVSSLILKYGWLCDSCKGEKRAYREKCAFTFNVFDFPNKFDLDLLVLEGWYSPKNSSFPNLNGISKDHVLSVNEGFKNGIPPEIISHPANCRLIRHRENQVKRSNSEITLDELLIKITEWENSCK